MSIAVVHLSDIHLKSPVTLNGILPRIPALRAAIRQGIVGADACVVVMSGDVAFSGKTAEYEIAKEFFRSLLNGIADDSRHPPIHFVVIPGNHDCDFSKDNQARRIIVDGAHASGFTDESPVEQCLRVQEGFVAFCDAISSIWPPVVCVPLTHWYHRQAVTVAGRRIGFQLFNSAWASRQHEKQGTLSFPV